MGIPCLRRQPMKWTATQHHLSIGVGDGVRGHLPHPIPPPLQKWDNTFPGKYHVKFRHLKNFLTYIFRQKCLAPPQIWLNSYAYAYNIHLSSLHCHSGSSDNARRLFGFVVCNFASRPLIYWRFTFDAYTNVLLEITLFCAVSHFRPSSNDNFQN